MRLCEPTEQCEPAPQGNAAAVEEEGGVAAESRPLWRRRWTGCGVRADGTPREGAVGGEGLALLIHNDPAGLEASGCNGPGVGYAFDASYFSTCPRRIRPSLALQVRSPLISLDSPKSSSFQVRSPLIPLDSPKSSSPRVARALQLSPHRNVSLVRRLGPHVASSEEPILAWDDSDSVGLHVNGSNVHALLQRSFHQPGRPGTLLDYQPHTVALVSSGRDVSVFLDGEEDPSLSHPLNMSAIGAVDAAGYAWVGFTAATGGTSLDADLLDFAFCSRPGCTAA